MNNEQDAVPLQEVVYKPTTQDNTPEILKPEIEFKSGIFFLYLTAIIASLLAFTSGIAFGWTSPVLPKMTERGDLDNNPLGRPITNSEESWIAGLLCLGAMFGPLVAGSTADRIGRKKTLLIVACPMGISLIMTAFAKTIWVFYVARLLIGIGAGSVFTVLPMYLGEIAEDHNRGTIGCFLGVFFSLGLVFSFAVGPFLTIQNFCIICLIPLIIFCPVFLIWIPETPLFLASVNNQTDLENSLSKLRGKTLREIQKELAEITKSAQEEEENKGGIKDLFTSRVLRKGLTITLGLIILQQFAGINAVLSYMQTIFKATGSGIAPEVSTIIIGLVQVGATILTSSLVDRLGRRILFLISSFGSCIALVGLGAYFYLQTQKFNVDSIFWMPVLSLLVFIISFNIGYGPLPWAVMGELFPSNVKSAASTLTSFTCFFAGFVITLLFRPLSLALGMAQSFWFFAMVCMVGVIFIYWMLPETKGKSLQEIQRMLESGKN